MKTEFLAAITQLSAERNLPKEEILGFLEAALASAYRKQAGAPDADVSVKIDPVDNKIRVHIRKVVVKAVSDPSQEILLRGARKIRKTAQLGETVEIDSTPETTGRIAIHLVKQAILQQLREAERHVVYGEFVNREGELVSGIINFIEPNQIYVKMNRTEALFPSDEYIPNERYYRRQRLKFYLLKVDRDARGPQIILSRSHPNLVRRFFELEIPEVHSGIVEIKAVAREPGIRSKVAVAATQERVDPVGCCLGARSIRLQSIISELNGEKIDVVHWQPDPSAFIANALSPAQVTNIHIDETEKTATIIVPDKQLSLAIGKEGQNARLAAKLTGWRIDIKSDSAAEAERALHQPALEEKEESPKTPVEPEEFRLPPALPEEILPPVIGEPAVVGELAAITEEEEPIGETLQEELPPPGKGASQIRFAEDIFPSLSLHNNNKGKQGKGKKAEKSKLKGKRHKRTLAPQEEENSSVEIDGNKR
ncbi:MAG: transcription termination/antitermination protein NusA [Dehalococcoidia bacterium]|nr:transcription termination/antitermination protein NusA [Dehalococcoidia bacterium]